MPCTFLLEDPAEYFQTDILARRHRSLTRACWSAALKKGNLNTPTKVGGETAPPLEDAGLRPPRAGGGGGTTPPSGRINLYGTCTPREQGRSLDHKPMVDGKALCWDFATHRGCLRGDGCLHLHRTIKPASTDWSVQLQLLRRGGVKEQKKLGEKEALAAIQRLRSADSASRECR